MSRLVDWIELCRREIARTDPIRVNGRVSQIIGLTIESHGPAAAVGDLCYVRKNGSDELLPAEVVGFRDERVILMPLGDMKGVSPGCEVISTGKPLRIGVGFSLLGRVLGGVGEPLDGKGPPEYEEERAVENLAPSPIKRSRITEPLPTGIRCIDALLTCGKGQRFGIFSGSGVGKSVLMGMIARYTKADVNVIALIGERGREVREFLEKDLGEEGMARSVVVAVTSDQPALIRLKGALVALTIAEFFRDQGKDVMLMMDSITRYAMAQREVGLAIGEPPATKGYTPSVFSLLPRLLERAGTSDRGSITGLFTVLVEADDFNEPISDAVRAILDGHIVLSRGLAARNHYPAIDVLSSVSRVMIDIVSPLHRQKANKVKETLAVYRQAEDLINIGAYVRGSNPGIDYAIDNIETINAFLRQDINEGAEFEDTVNRLMEIV